MVIPRYIIGFTGHRHLTDAESIRAAIYASLEALKNHACAKGSQIELYSSAAYGADLLALECATRLSIPIHLSLPLPEEEFVHDFAGHEEEWLQAQTFIQSARAGTNGGTFRVQRSKSRKECYYAEATKLVDACDLLLAVWDGAKAQGLGGTAHVIELAVACQKPVLRIDTVAPQPIPAGEIPRVWPKEDERIATINQYLEDQEIQSTATAEQLETALDTIANLKAPTFRKGMARSIKLHSFAALLGAVPSLFYFAFISDPKKPSAAETTQWNTIAFLFAAAELVCVLVALLINWQVRLRKVKHKWRYSRLATELVRGLRASRPWLDPLHPLSARHLPEWRRFILTVNLMAQADALSDQPFTEQKKKYCTNRIDPQQKHFATKAREALKAHQRWSRTAKWAAITSPFFVLIALIDKAQGGLFSQSWHGALFAKFLPVALPLLAGVATALRNTLDLTRRSTRYPEMKRRLEEKATALVALETGSSCESVIAQTEEILLDEILEWNQSVKSAGGH